MLMYLATRIAISQGNQVALETQDMESVPNAYRKIVKDTLIQLVRNAVVHGIETGAERS